MPDACQKCGTPDRAPLVKGLCAVCRWRDRRPWPSWPLHPIPALNAHLGLPLDTPSYADVSWGALTADELPGFCMETVSILFDGPVRVATWPAGAVTSSTAPWPEDPYPFAVRLRVYHFERPIFLEAQRRPGILGWQMSIGGLSDRRADRVDGQHILAAWQSRSLLTADARVGPATGSGTWEDAEHFKRVVGPAVRELYARHGRPPSARAVLRHLRTQLGHVDPSLFTRWYRGFGWKSWAHFRNEVLTEGSPSS
jgi:hypothetical protein